MLTRREFIGATAASRHAIYQSFGAGGVDFPALMRFFANATTTGGSVSISTTSIRLQGYRSSRS
jgi:hypothetical protein